MSAIYVGSQELDTWILGGSSHLLGVSASYRTYRLESPHGLWDDDSMILQEVTPWRFLAGRYILLFAESSSKKQILWEIQCWGNPVWEHVLFFKGVP